MKFLKRLLLFVFISILLYIAHIFISTGYFRTIENNFNGEVVKKIIINEEEFGGLYYMNLKTGDYSVKKLTSDFKKSFAPHGISILKIGNTYKVMAVNHTPKGHSFEVFRLENEILTHIETLTHPTIMSPNDIVMLDAHRFYFTNDHKYTEGIGKLLEDYGGLSISNVIYFDGQNYTKVASGIAYANGINYDAKRNLLFVASPRKFLVKVYHRNEDGSLDFIENIDCDTGVDNIEFDTDGNLWIGAHPNLLHFASYAKGKKAIAPSEIIKINYKGKKDYTIEKIYVN